MGSFELAASILVCNVLRDLFACGRSNNEGSSDIANNREKIEALSETHPSQFESVPHCKQGSVGFKCGPETVVLQDDLSEKKRPKTPVNGTLNPQYSTILKEPMKHPTLAKNQGS
ncbi:hypothetical protein GOBAR_DD15464 [Gossypium barbadense]|nr:hypothetical protein GOBAR_DD15464 [Gossypium barbadense]